MTSTFTLGVLGGLVSFASTSGGAVFSLLGSRKRRETSARYSLPIDFALGVMVAASAFSLIGPVAYDARASAAAVARIAFAAVAGGLVIALAKALVDRCRAASEAERAPVPTARFILAAMLMLHNFPEGLACGAAVAGLGWKAAAGVLGAIAIQNVPEGALMVICLRTMGWRTRAAFLGGIASGLVELAGGAVAGAVLGVTVGALPYLLSFAGGAMMSSVVIELLEPGGSAWERVRSPQFRTGFLALAALQGVAFLATP